LVTMLAGWVEKSVEGMQSWFSRGNNSWLRRG
jgi:hypothetical protein